jgi:membrane carboxypeptidase/penicillin-binding protein
MTARRILAPLLLALVVLAVLGAVVAWLPLLQARASWRAGKNADAVTEAARWAKMQPWRAQHHQLLAAAWLSAGSDAAASPHLRSVAQTSRVWIPIVRKDEVARHLFARGRYDQFLAYDSAFRELFECDDVPLYRAAAHAARNRLSEAEAMLQGIDRGEVDAKRLAALEQNLATRKKGSFPIVLGRDGKTIAAYEVADDDIVAVDANFAALVEAEAGKLTFESRLKELRGADVLETTLDPAVQKAAMAALGGFRGSLVAIDPRTNELLAIATNRGRGPLANLAVEHEYEPGSVIKVLSGASALANRVNLDYPYNCTGNLVIDGRQFGDWLQRGHGTVRDFDHALAESCNVVFADYGVRLGRDRLRALMSKAGFDGQVDTGVFPAPMGRTVGEIFNKFETAFYAIGLEHQTITTLHLAMIGSTMANRGVLTAPRLVVARRSILGDRSETATVQKKTEVVSRDVAERVVRAMTAVVTDKKGTGRRAAVPGLSLALKTGTAGREEDGYHALVVGFAPVESPKIAFALIAESAGPAEFAAAKIARDFLVAMKARL